MTDNADSDAGGTTQDEPRWVLFSVSSVGDLIFLGRAGPIDVWADSGDRTGVPFYVRQESSGFWSGDPERIIQRCRDQRIHLTLHDECIIHQLCATHNPNTNNTNQI